MARENREPVVSATAVLRVEPDIAVVSLAIIQADDDPKAAYSKAHDAAATVRRFTWRPLRIESSSSSWLR
jgi:hypothetical protein